MGQILSKSSVIGSTILPVVALDYSVQAACCAVAIYYHTEKFYDFSGSATYILCTALALYWRPYLQPYLSGQISLNDIPPLSSFHPRQLFAAGLTGLWAARLGTFLLERVIANGGDSRFDKVKHKPGTFAFYWFMQAVWIAATASPVYIVSAVPRSLQPALNWKDYTGLGLWATGFLMEVIADRQKNVWRRRRTGGEPFIHEGLWSISRHPNYFGESTLWAGMWLLCYSGLSRLPPQVLSPLAAKFTAISPIFVTFLLTKLSGIPILEKSSDKKFGALASYQDYKRNTPVFIPFIGRKN